MVCSANPLGISQRVLKAWNANVNKYLKVLNTHDLPSDKTTNCLELSQWSLITDHKRGDCSSCLMQPRKVSTSFRQLPAVSDYIIDNVLLLTRE